MRTYRPKIVMAAGALLLSFWAVGLEAQRGWRTPARGIEPRQGRTPDQPRDAGSLTQSEVEAIVETGVTALDKDGYSVVVVDRAGRILAVWQKPGATLDTAERALALARTGAFFSNDQAPLSSRTVRFISGIHFPPGIPFQPNGALYGIENTNRGCAFSEDDRVLFNSGRFVPRATSLRAFLRETGLEPGVRLPCNGEQQTGCGMGAYTGKFSAPFADGRFVDVSEEELLDLDPLQVHGGGIPIFKDCRLAGGVGVFGVAPDQAEFAALLASMPAALNASAGGPVFGPVPCLAPPFAVYLDGIRLPFVGGVTQPPGTAPGAVEGDFLVPPMGGGVAADGWLVGGPERPLGSARLSPTEVEQIVNQSIEAASLTRAAIRLPLGSRTRMVIAVSDLEGNVLGLFRMPDSTVFSIDVAVAKARNVVYFSGPRRLPADLPDLAVETAVTNRTISFGSQPLYPPGIEATEPGPFFDLYRNDVLNPCSQGFDQENLPRINGIVFFPGSAPLYKDGELVGGLGISGDGVEQDDVVTDLGSRGFQAPVAIQADQFFVRGVRLPYLKFNRNPEK